MEPTQGESSLRRVLDDLLLAGEQPGAVLAALKAVEDGSVHVRNLYTKVLGPLMTDTGARWREGETRVWQEHLASATVRIIVDALFPIVYDEAARVPRRGFVVLACPPEEQHDLGLRMLTDRLALAGWHPYFLGADTPITEVADAARTLHAELVMLTADTHFARVRLAEYVDELRALLPGVRVVVGGVAFDRQHEGWAADDFLADDDLEPLAPPRPRGDAGGETGGASDEER